MRDEFPEMPIFPTSICPDAEAGVPHAKHRIAGTWRQECPGVELTAEQRDAHSSAYWEGATEGLRREPAFTEPAGTTYGRPTPMPAPAAEPVEGRTPDAYGVAVGDLIAGTCVSVGWSTVGEVIEILPRVPFAGMDGNRYRVRVGDVYATGGVIERIVHDHPRVVVPAGNPVVCATCEAGVHESARRFVDCLIAHVRAEREAAAASA